MKPRFFGQYLLEKGYVTEKELLEALEYQHSKVMKIGQIAMEKGYMTSEQVEKVNLEQRRTDKFFGELAVSLGFLTEQQLEKIITIQKHNHIFLGEALVKLGFLDKEQVMKFLDDFHQEQKPIASLDDIIPEMLVNREEVFVLLDTAIKIFRRMANLYLKLGKGFFKSTKVENLHLISAVHFTGTMDFKYFLNLPPNVAVEIARNLYRNDSIEYTDEVICDCVGELTNVICGNACSQILELGQKVYITPPETILRKNTPIVAVEDDRQALVFPSTVPTGYLELGVRWITPPHDDKSGKKTTVRENRVMLVDDSALCRKQLKDIIDTIAGIRVAGEAEDGAKAVEMYKTLMPDMVIVDLVMPGMPGEELIRRIKELDESAKIIVMSGVGGSANTIFEEFKVGVDVVISKPIDAEEVKRAIRKVIQ